MKHKVAELEGALLDAAVAKAESCSSAISGTFRPSTDWMDGGPIIERELISLMHLGEHGREWSANFELPLEGRDQYDRHTEPTPLIAAMRAFVASKFGDEIELL